MDVAKASCSVVTPGSPLVRPHDISANPLLIKRSRRLRHDLVSDVEQLRTILLVLIFISKYSIADLTSRRRFEDPCPSTESVVDEERRCDIGRR